ncbi:MAG: hypothetical protein LAO76_20975 [Acidobacteriia bacterium]|nr:hypothetical protein [Terriglobia bacterium]
MTLEQLVNDFAIRSFRDQGDEDYISARLACRAALPSVFLWACQQTIEKYLKCILLLNRIPAIRVKHDLGAALTTINHSGKLTVILTPPTQDFIKQIDTFGRFRYFEIPNFASGTQIIALDRAAWELRRYCTFSLAQRQIVITDGQPVPKVRLVGGFLEQIIDDNENPAREPLLWQNAFFGRRRRSRVSVYTWSKMKNSPLYLHPEILDEVLKYVFLPKDVITVYRSHKVSKNP